MGTYHILANWVNGIYDEFSRPLREQFEAEFRAKGVDVREPEIQGLIKRRAASVLDQSRPVWEKFVHRLIVLFEHNEQLNIMSVGHPGWLKDVNVVLGPLAKEVEPLFAEVCAEIEAMDFSGEA